MYYVDYEFSVYFLKFVSFFLLAKFSPTIWNSPNRLQFGIWIYMTTVLMSIFPQCSPFNFSDNFGLSMLLILSQKIVTLVACRIFCFPKWFKFVFWNLGTRITNTRIQSYVHERVIFKEIQWRLKNFNMCHNKPTSLLKISLFHKCSSLAFTKKERYQHQT